MQHRQQKYIILCSIARIWCELYDNWNAIKLFYQKSVAQNFEL